VQNWKPIRLFGELKSSDAMILSRRKAMGESADLKRRGFLVSLCGLCPAAVSTAHGTQRTSANQPQLSDFLTTEDRIALALMRFKGGYHCSQSVLAAYADEFELDTDLALKLAAGLAGGSTVGGECGTVSAGYLVLGMKHGRVVPAGGDVEREKALFGRIRQFVDTFRTRHGSINCRELLGVDVFTKEGHQEGLSRHLYTTRCPNYIRDAITIIDSLG
jgi:C_GCAxxG_C_C family probable redox protein